MNKTIEEKIKNLAGLSKEELINLVNELLRKNAILEVRIHYLMNFTKFADETPMSEEELQRRLNELFSKKHE